MTDKIEFGEGFTAEPRGDGEYYITHPNGGGAMASTAEAALIRALVAVCAERDALVADWDALESLHHAEIYIDKTGGAAMYAIAIHLMRHVDGDELRVTTIGGNTLREAIAAARKRQEGATQ